MQLSPHFTLAEFTVSETAARQGIDNTPTPEIIANLKRLTERLEKVRAVFNAPVLITSGYRSPALNAAVGGVKNSAHTTGCAADFIVPSQGPPLQVAIRISNFPGVFYDQLIVEYNQWVHLGIEQPDVEPRNERWTYRRGEQPVPYLC